MIVTLDTETTTRNKGHPFDPRNQLCVVGTKVLGEQGIVWKIQYDDEPFGDAIKALRTLLDRTTLLVLFNAKFDLHWLRRYGLHYTGRVWDCQSGVFVLSGQTRPYPSLVEACAEIGILAKQSRIPEYWEAGINTTDIPYDELHEYLLGDLSDTEALYIHQVVSTQDNPKQQRLLSLVNQDTLVLEEMEWNGLLYDVEESKRLAAEGRDRLVRMSRTLSDLVNLTGINWNSPDQVSAVLYGGNIVEKYKEKFVFTYKDPKKPPVEKERWSVRLHELPRLVEPLPNTKLAKDGYWSTGEGVIRKLKPRNKKAKEIISLMIEYGKLEKLVSSYYEGIPKLIEEKGWEDHVLHGQLNQCVAVTGRLSSSDPNQQNQPKAVKKLIRSRFNGQSKSNEVGEKVSMVI